jgi:hypothetical protein
VQQAGTAQLTLTLGRHFGQDVALESVLVLEARSCLQEALRSTALGFHFWHVELRIRKKLHNNHQACRAREITSSFWGR